MSWRTLNVSEQTSLQCCTSCLFALGVCVTNRLCPSWVFCSHIKNKRASKKAKGWASAIVLFFQWRPSEAAASAAVLLMHLFLDLFFLIFFCTTEASCRRASTNWSKFRTNVKVCVCACVCVYRCVAALFLKWGWSRSFMKWLLLSGGSLLLSVQASEGNPGGRCIACRACPGARRFVYVTNWRTQWANYREDINEIKNNDVKLKVQVHSFSKCSRSSVNSFFAQ